MNMFSKNKVACLLSAVILSVIPSLGYAVVKGAGTESQSSATPTLAPEGTPTRQIQDIEAKMDQFKTGNNLTEADKANNAKIKRDILNGTFDLRELSRLALDRHWNQISAAEQNNFVDLMTDLLETRAIFAREHRQTQGKSYQVQYIGDTYSDNKAAAKTSTKVIIPKENLKVAINYNLKKNSSAWKIYDVNVDGASLVENYRYQFDNIITKQGYPELVKRMRKKLVEMKAKK